MTNFSKSKSLYKDGMSPVFRAGPSGDRTWERVHPKNVFYLAKDALAAPSPPRRERRGRRERARAVLARRLRRKRRRRRKGHPQRRQRERTRAAAAEKTAHPILHDAFGKDDTPMLNALYEDNEDPVSG